MSESSYQQMQTLIKEQAAEIKRLKEESKAVDEECNKQAEQMAELWEFVIDSQHHAGCSGGFDEKYRCKCGLRELLKKYKAAQPQEGER